MLENGCENCHGPGSAHVAAEQDGADEAAVTRLREEMRLSLADAEVDALAALVRERTGLATEGFYGAASAGLGEVQG